MFMNQVVQSSSLFAVKQCAADVSIEPEDHHEGGPTEQSLRSVVEASEII